MNLSCHLCRSRAPVRRREVFTLSELLFVIGLAALSSFGALGAKGAIPQQREWLIKSWQTEDGLPENSATAMVQTPDGYLWFGTFDGLVRFDGVKFTVFDHQNTPELPDSGIINLHLDKRGRLWISTYGGLVVREGNRWQGLTREEANAQDFVRTFAERENGDILMTKFNGKVVEFSNGHLTELPAPPGEPSRGYLGQVDELGQWWVVQNKFIGRWDGRAWISTIPVTVVRDSIGCAKAKDGGLWLLLGPELRKFSRGVEVSHVVLPEFPGGCWSMTEDSRSNVWICTIDSGVVQVSPNGQMTRWNESNGLPYHAARFAFEDSESNIWIGTSGGGLVRLKPRRFQGYGVENGLSERNVRSVWPAPDGGLWVMTFGKGLFRLDETGITNVEIPQWTHHYGESVLTDKSGRTWAGTYMQGLVISGTNGWERIPASETGGDNILALFEDSRGGIWSSGGDGVSVYESGTFHTFGEEQGLPHSGVCCFGEGRDGVLWLSNFRGLFHREKERFVEVRDPQNHPISDITCILGDLESGLWLGSAKEGLLRWRNGSLSRIGPEAGLPVTRVNGIIADDEGFFWITSNRGVVHARRRDLESAAKGGGYHLTCQLFDMSDGLPSVELAAGQEPTCAKDAKGRLWFATVKGVAMADPGRLRLNSHAPPVMIEEVVYHTGSQLDAERAKTEQRVRAPFGERLQLPPGSRNIEIHYTALSFSSPEKVYFQTRLQSHGTEWQDVGGRRVAYFDELRPGENLFEIKAANDDGFWNDTGASLAFAVTPFFWQTAWFRMLGWVGVGAEALLIVALLLAMERRRRAKQALREQLSFEQLLSELSRVFVNVPVEKVEAQIREAVRKIGEELEFDIAAFSTLASGEQEGRVSVFWNRAGVDEVTCERLKEELPWSAGQLSAGRDVWLPRISNLPAEAETDRATYSKYGVQSSYQVPVYAGGSVAAAFNLCAVGEPREMKRELLQRQRLLGEIFVNALTRKRSEERRRESEARFRIVADSAPVMIWMSGVDKLCTFFNKTWLDFTGRTLDQEMGNGWAEGVHRSDLESCLRLYGEAFDARKPFVLHYRLRRHDGQHRWIFDSGVPRYDAQGEFAGYVGSCVDFTERKEAEERMTLAAEAANLGMWMWDIPRGKIWSTEKFRELFGFTDFEEISFDKIEERIHPQDRQLRHETLEHVVKTAGSYEVEYRVVTPEGVERWIASKSRADSDEGGRPTRVVGVCVDITERRRASLEMLNLRQELAHSGRVTMMGQLASALAHELSQPLGAILRNAEAAELFLQSSEPDLEEVRGIINDIHKDDQRAGAVIERLRSLLKRRDIEMQPLDAGRLAEDILPLLRPDAQSRRVAIELEKASGLPFVRGDRVQLQQVLLNLVVNGMDAVTDCEPNRRRVRLRVEPDGDRFVAVAVSDSGHGIPTGKLKSLFEPFFTTKANGMGLGLSISRTIVEAHGGRMWAINNPEGGATFRFTVPVANGGSGK